MTLPSAPAPAVCQHCGKSVSARRVRRGLCRRCYGSPQDGYSFSGVRAEYGHRYTNRAGQVGSQQSTDHPHKRDFSGPAPLPTRQPVEPGPQKLETLSARAQHRQALFHPEEPSHPLEIPRLNDYNRLWVWRLLIAADPSILTCLISA